MTISEDILRRIEREEAIKTRKKKLESIRGYISDDRLSMFKDIASKRIEEGDTDTQKEKITQILRSFSDGSQWTWEHDTTDIAEDGISGIVYRLGVYESGVIKDPPNYILALKTKKNEDGTVTFLRKIKPKP